MKKLLVPVDGSDPALHAVKQAIGLARLLAGEIHLLNVQPPLESVRIYAHFAPEQLALLQRQAGEDALAAAKQLLKEAGMPFRVTVECGPVASTIVDFAEKISCDGIVMGTRGLGALGAFVLGSVATKVVHQVDTPVVLVK